MDASWLPMVSFLGNPARWDDYMYYIYCIYIYMELQKKFGESLIDDELQKVWTVAHH